MSSETVFILGPHHHFSTDCVSVTPFTHHETPFGNLEIDVESNSEDNESTNGKKFFHFQSTQYSK